MHNRILVLDDDPSNGDVLCMILEQEGYQTKCVYSALNVFEIINTFNPHILFLDIHLGADDGRLLCNKIKDRLGAKKLPIILISAMSPNQIDTIQSKADGIIYKPFEIDEVIATAKKFTQNQ